ncbi:hypothetical protein PR048_010679 [Dryococelus australis]|uniref:Uncharacterized protein n=1 Tax=Dryococelus australis TaxID=614101 RepID=A0ABQ9I3D4_9NEOP|nr:hypothetical protein PR048_010679 [Dryococelus australis]
MTYNLFAYRLTQLTCSSHWTESFLKLSKPTSTLKLQSTCTTIQVEEFLIIPAHAGTGFECTGIFPYNPDVIPEEECLPSTVFSPQEKPSVSVSGGFASTPAKLDFCQTTSVGLNSNKEASSSGSPDFSEILSTPVKPGGGSRPNTGGNRKRKSRLLTSEANISACRENRKIKILTMQETTKDHQSSKCSHTLFHLK